MADNNTQNTDLLFVNTLLSASKAAQSAPDRAHLLNEVVNQSNPPGFFENLFGIGMTDTPLIDSLVAQAGSKTQQAQERQALARQRGLKLLNDSGLFNLLTPINTLNSQKL